MCTTAHPDFCYQGIPQCGIAGRFCSRSCEKASQYRTSQPATDEMPLRSIYEWRIFDADEEETTEEPVSASAAHKEFKRTVALSPAGHFELHHRVAGGEWEVVC